MMKRVFAMMLVCVMVVSMLPAASAAEVVPSVEVRDPVEIVGGVIYITLPDGTVIEMGVDGLTITNVSGEVLYRLPSQLLPFEMEEYKAAMQKLIHALDVLRKITIFRNSFGRPQFDYANFRPAPEVDAVNSGDNVEQGYVVTHLFDITFWQQTEVNVDKAVHSGGHVTITFDLGVVPNKPVYIATMCDEEWEILDDEYVTNNNDGTVTIEFHDFCPVAVIVEKDTGGEVVPSPPTANALPVAVYGCGALGVLACVCFLADRRKKV